MNLDLTGASPWNPLAQRLEEGPARGKIKDVDPNYNGGKSTEFAIEITEGPNAGRVTSLYLGNDLSPKDGEPNANTRKWFLFLLAVAPDEAKMKENLTKSPKLDNFDPKALVGKPIHINITAPAQATYKDEKGVEKTSAPDREFVTKSQFDSLVAARAANPPKNGATGGEAKKEEKPAGGSTLDKLFAT